VLARLIRMVRKENVYDQIRYPSHKLVRMNVQTWKSLGSHRVGSGHMYEVILLLE